MTQATAEHNARRLVALQSQGDAKPLFVFPGIHGTPETFADFAAQLQTESSHRPVYGFRHIGSQNECDPVRQVRRLAQLYAAEVRIVQPRGPYFLFGYALGGVIAFEVARELRSQAERVGLVIMADCPAPFYPQPAPVWMRARTHLKNLFQQSPRERIAYVRERLKNGVIRVGRIIGHTPQSPQTTPDEPVPEHLQRVDAALYEAYQYYELTPQCVDVLFLTADTPPDWPTVVFDDPLMGWGRALRGRISQCSIPGTHLSIFAPENLPVLAERVRAGLAHAERVERSESAGLAALGKAS